MENERQGYWWCETCQAEKSAQQVKFDETCTFCGQPVVWQILCELCSRAGGAGLPIYHDEPACTEQAKCE
jgi:hypothetical protein